MPTREDFELAANLFESASDQAAVIAAELAAARTDDVIIGGVLGQAVPATLTEAATTTSGCVQRLADAAELCRVRAALIAEYELAYESYRLAHEAWQHEQAAALMMAFALGGGVGGAASPEPIPPPPLPPWADIAFG